MKKTSDKAESETYNDGTLTDTLCFEARIVGRFPASMQTTRYASQKLDTFAAGEWLRIML